MTHTVIPTHIDLIRPGDTVLIDGHLKTVGPNDIKRGFVKDKGWGRMRRSAYIVLGNDGWDCINDHTCSNPSIPEDDFEAVMKTVDTLAEQLQET